VTGDDRTGLIFCSHEQPDSGVLGQFLGGVEPQTRVDRDAELVEASAQQAIEAGPIDMPARTVEIRDEVVESQTRRSPGGATPQAWFMPIILERRPKAQLLKRTGNVGRQ